MIITFCCLSMQFNHAVDPPDNRYLTRGYELKVWFGFMALYTMSAMTAGWYYGTSDEKSKATEGSLIKSDKETEMNNATLKDDINRGDGNSTDSRQEKVVNSTSDFEKYLTPFFDGENKNKLKSKNDLAFKNNKTQPIKNSVAFEKFPLRAVNVSAPEAQDAKAEPNSDSKHENKLVYSYPKNIEVEPLSARLFLVPVTLGRSAPTVNQMSVDILSNNAGSNNRVPLPEVSFDSIQITEKGLGSKDSITPGMVMKPALPQKLSNTFVAKGRSYPEVQQGGQIGSQEVMGKIVPVTESRSTLNTYNQQIHDARLLLGIDTEATAKEIRKAVRELIQKRKQHPDHGGDAEAFEMLIKARDTLLENLEEQSRRRTGQLASQGSKKEIEYKAIAENLKICPWNSGIETELKDSELPAVELYFNESLVVSTKVTGLDRSAVKKNRAFLNVNTIGNAEVSEVTSALPTVIREHQVVSDDYGSNSVRASLPSFQSAHREQTVIPSQHGMSIEPSKLVEIFLPNDGSSKKSEVIDFSVAFGNHVTVNKSLSPMDNTQRRDYQIPARRYDVLSNSSNTIEKGAHGPLKIHSSVPMESYTFAIASVKSSLDVDHQNRLIQQARALLELNEQATANDVRRAYRRLIKQQELHPDSGGSSESMARVNNARDILLKSSGDNSENSTEKALTFSAFREEASLDEEMNPDSSDFSEQALLTSSSTSTSSNNKTTATELAGKQVLSLYGAGTDQVQSLLTATMMTHHSAAIRKIQSGRLLAGVTELSVSGNEQLVVSRENGFSLSNPVHAGKSYSYGQFYGLDLKQEKIGDLSAFDAEGYGFEVGVFRQISNEWSLGLFTGIQKMSSHFRDSMANMKATNYRIGPFAGWYKDPWYFDVAVTYGWSELESERYQVTDGQLRTARQSTSEWSLFAGFGYKMNLDEILQGLILTPGIELISSSIRMGELKEKGESGQLFYVKPFHKESLIVRSGLQINYLVPGLESSHEYRLGIGFQRNYSGQNRMQIESNDSDVFKFKNSHYENRSMYYSLGYSYIKSSDSSFHWEYTGSKGDRSRSHGVAVTYEKRF
ncbi:hypothetical protein EOPP23_11960 [Endozoicomonas sp. OPT23]|uniref:autotransporter domain-containing protein n=1 Tax=Endozoicomonas sp. OPT23 TaxID=2072845 RepID=UPI00129AE41F|nr:autotransporter domain-containing protein [Endozoicomonas sp. OPT23]MRI33701.1 hypothetical protein [Endozoicomonas sp. OPT23]